MFSRRFFNRTMVSCTFAVCVLLNVGAAYSQAGKAALQNAPVTKPAAAAKKTITLNMPKGSLAEVVAELGAKYQINIVTDAFLNADAFRKNVNLTNVPVEEGLFQIASLFGRDMLFVNGVVVLRHQDFPRKVLDDEAVKKRSQLRWKGRGTVKVSRIETGVNAAAAVAKNQAQNNTTERDKPAPMKMRLPANLLSLEASEAPAADVVDYFSQEIGWNVNVGAALADRRVNISVRGVTPGQTLSALTTLFNAAQTVTLRQTLEQQEQDVASMSSQNPSTKEFEALRQAVLAVLSRDQYAQLADGKKVSLEIGTLPESLQKQAATYIGNFLTRIGDGGTKPLGYTLDPANYSKFSLVVKPDLEVETHAFMSNAQPPYTEGMAVVF